MIRLRNISLGISQLLFRGLRRLPVSMRTVLLVTVYVVAGLGLEQAATIFATATEVNQWDPAAGLHFVLLLGFGLRYIPELLLIPLLDMLVVNPLGIAPIYVVICALWIMLGYGLACSLLLHKLHIDPRLRRFRDVFRFVVVSLVAPLIVSGLFVTTLAKAGSVAWSEWGIQVLRDWAGEATGIAMLAPPLLLLLRAAPWDRSHITLARPTAPIRLRWPKSAEAVEGGLEVIALGGAIWLAYGLPRTASLEYSYFVFLPLIWICVRHGFERAVLAVLSINIGVALLVYVQPELNDPLAVQFCLLTVTYTGLLLEAVVSESKRVEASLRESKQEYQNLYDCAPDSYASIAADGTIKSINQVGADFLGYRKAELIGQPVSITVYEADRQQAQQWLTNVFRERLETSENELRKVRKDGSVTWVRERSQLLLDKHRTPTELHMICRDITERKQAEEQLRYNAFHDALTGLPNRALLMDRLERVIAHRQRHEDYLFAVLFMDLDRFKVINDSLGHTLGDQFLVAIADKLKSCLRLVDTAARLGGDEFTLLLEDINDLSDAIRVAERVQVELRTPFNLSGQEVFTTASIGIVFSRSYDRPEDLLRDADIAMYRAKGLGKARYEIFSPDLRDRAVIRLQLETELRRAIEHQELRVHYQPIVSLETGRLNGFEALVRWQHPDRGLISPAVFLPLAEETGLIISIDQWVLREACCQIQQWQTRFPTGAQPLMISVNLGSPQFWQPELLAHINQVLQQTRLDAPCLKLEISENSIMENDQTVTDLFSQLRDLGIQLVVDDFGTGYSSLARLHHFPISELKIDRSFISPLGTDSTRGNLEIVETILALAQKLGVDVTAEGIETAEQLGYLRDLNCGYGQGYFFSRPLAPEAVETLMISQPEW